MQLYSLRAQIDALIAAEEADIQTVPGASGLWDRAAASGCPHPEDMRVNASNFGEEPKFHCRVCQETVKGAA